MTATQEQLAWINMRLAYPYRLKLLEKQRKDWVMKSAIKAQEGRKLRSGVVSDGR